MCSVRKKHFLSIAQCFAFAVAWEWEGVCPSLESSSGTSRSAGSRFPETGALGATGALSSDRRQLRGGRLGASSPGPGCSPLGIETHPESGFSILTFRPFCFCNPWELGIQGFCASQTQPVVGPFRSRVPDLALGAHSQPSSPGLRHRPRPNPLSPGGFCFPRPQHWPSGHATLQTWAGFLSPTHSLSPPPAPLRSS